MTNSIADWLVSGSKPAAEAHEDPNIKKLREELAAALAASEDSQRKASLSQEVLELVQSTNESLLSDLRAKDTEIEELRRDLSAAQEDQKKLTALRTEVNGETGKPGLRTKLATATRGLEALKRTVDGTARHKGLRQELADAREGARRLRERLDGTKDATESTQELADANQRIAELERAIQELKTEVKVFDGSFSEEYSGSPYVQVVLRNGDGQERTFTLTTQILGLLASGNREEAIDRYIFSVTGGVTALEDAARADAEFALEVVSKSPKCVNILGNLKYESIVSAYPDTVHTTITADGQNVEIKLTEHHQSYFFDKNAISTIANYISLDYKMAAVAHVMNYTKVQVDERNAAGISERYLTEVAAAYLVQAIVLSSEFIGQNLNVTETPVPVLEDIFRPMEFGDNPKIKVKRTAGEITHITLINPHESVDELEFDRACLNEIRAATTEDTVKSIIRDAIELQTRKALQTDPDDPVTEHAELDRQTALVMRTLGYPKEIEKVYRLIEFALGRTAPPVALGTVPRPAGGATGRELRSPQKY